MKLVVYNEYAYYSIFKSVDDILNVMLSLDEHSCRIITPKSIFEDWPFNKDMNDWFKDDHFERELYLKNNYRGAAKRIVSYLIQEKYRVAPDLRGMMIMPKDASKYITFEEHYNVIQEFIDNGSNKAKRLLISSGRIGKDIQFMNNLSDIASLRFYMDYDIRRRNENC